MGSVKSQQLQVYRALLVQEYASYPDSSVCRLYPASTGGYTDVLIQSQ